MAQIRLHIDRDAVEGDPAADPHADGGNFVLAPTASVNPDADPAFTPLTLDVETGQRLDHPFLHQDCQHQMGQESKQGLHLEL